MVSRDFDINFESQKKIQNKLKEKIIIDELKIQPHLIAGADASYAEEGKIIYAVFVVIEIESFEIAEIKSAKRRVDFPYRAGYLSFREGPAFIDCFEKLKSKPDVVIFDGNGIAHPRGIGIASHLGLCLDLPTIGCAKSHLFGSFEEPEEERGSFSPLYNEGNVIGYVVRTRSKVKPVFVSPGHKISAEQARDLVLLCCRGYRIPEPVRVAHINAQRLIKEEL